MAIKWGSKITVNGNERPSFLRDEDILDYGSSPSSYSYGKDVWIKWSRADWEIVNRSFFLKADHPYYKKKVEVALMTMKDIELLFAGRNASWYAGAKALAQHLKILEKTDVEKIVEASGLDVESVNKVLKAQKNLQTS